MTTTDSFAVTFGSGNCEDSSRCRIYCTVVTGFEATARDDCKERFGSDMTDIHTERGALRFNIPLARVSDLFTLRSVDNLFAVVLEGKKKFSDDKEEAMKEVREFATTNSASWKVGYVVWEEACRKVIPDQFEKNGITVPKQFNEASEYNPSYRATCYRSGKHCFTSQEAMVEFGGALNTKYGWKVDLSNYDVEVVLIVDDDRVSVCLTLTREPMFKRNMTYFGTSTLRATIAYNMLRLGEVKPGEIVCDPMCGSGAIPVEAALSYPNAFILGGDIYEQASDKTSMNIRDISLKIGQSLHNVDTINWDLAAFPLREALVDVWVSDFPFGKRHRCHRKTLYPMALDAMARASKPNASRAIILTTDRVAIWDAVKARKHWFIKRHISVNVGGLTACVFLLLRTSFV